MKEAGKPLHSKEITKIALERGLLKTAGKTPMATMNAQLVVDINSKGELSDFKKSGPSIFALNDKKVEIGEDSKPDRIIEELELEEEKEVEGGYIGKAGEHAVLSELLFLGYNAALMSVDVGVDIVATKNNEIYNIQVKTRNISKRHDAFHFNWGNRKAKRLFKARDLPEHFFGFFKSLTIFKADSSIWYCPDGKSVQERDCSKECIA